MTAAFREYQAQVVVNARTMADDLASLGYRIVSGGTDTHLLLVDLSPKGLSGARAQEWLGQAGIIANKNAIPFDRRPPIDPSGIRLGTPSITSRGAKEAEARQVIRWIHLILTADDPAQTARTLRQETLAFCRSYPLPD